MEPYIDDKDRPMAYAAVPVEGSMEAVVGSLAQHWPAVFGWLAERGIEPAGAPFIRYCSIDMPQRMKVEIGIPTAERHQGDDRVICGELPVGRYAQLLHVGHYDGLMAATAALLEWGDRQDLLWDAEFRGDENLWAARLESYLTDPASEPDPDQWRTLISLKLADES